MNCHNLLQLSRKEFQCFDVLFVSEIHFSVYLSYLSFVNELNIISLVIFFYYTGTFRYMY